jgi:hypothetical protein
MDGIWGLKSAWGIRVERLWSGGQKNEKKKHISGLGSIGWATA